MNFIRGFLYHNTTRHRIISDKFIETIEQLQHNRRYAVHKLYDFLSVILQKTFFFLSRFFKHLLFSPIAHKSIFNIITKFNYNLCVRELYTHIL